jgi:hypothetical protein
MSLLAAFVAMLGKQWLSRYLRHAGGSMVERCGDRQRKIDGLERWPFRLFIESLPVMLQIALLLLSCGLSRYVWSVNISVARVVISFTVLGVIFYLGIVIAGTSSYECPFQTPASTALRALRGKRMTQRLLASLSPPRVISSVYIAWRDARQGFASRYRHIRDAVMDLQSWRISSPNISWYCHERRTPNHTFYSFVSIELSGTQSRDWFNGFEGANAQHCSQSPTRTQTISYTRCNLEMGSSSL